MILCTGVETEIMISPDPAAMHVNSEEKFVGESRVLFFKFGDTLSDVLTSQTSLFRFL